jgi:cobalt/nickel transport system permease protein
MHMSDALLSPSVGGTAWVAAGAVVGYCARKVRNDLDSRAVPLMGVLGAFVFAAQMVNFAIPGTGSSGHLGGGMMLAILLGPHAAFLTMASILTVQALFFADGGLLALGCNILNLGFLPCFIAYPLLYRPVSGAQLSPRRLTTAAVFSSVVGLQLGSLAVVLQTVASGVSALPLSGFAALMLPIHLVIGLVEGAVTAAVVNFLRKAEPELVLAGVPVGRDRSFARRAVIGLATGTVLTAGVLSWFSSSNPDGLEWAIARVTGEADLGERPERLHSVLAAVQRLTSFFPEYALPEAAEAAADPPPVGAPDAGTSLAGLVGAAITLGAAGLLGLLLQRRAGKTEQSSDAVS